MRKEIADLIFPVLRKALEIKEGLNANPEAWDFADSQRRLLAMLQTAVPDALRPDLIGEQRALDSAASGGARLGFLGIHYALACWLDETFIADSPWRNQWNDRKLETTLFGTNERATEFWRQAERAQNRPTRDAVEVYFLCVMLGFRGELLDKPAELAAWRDRVEAQITQAEGRDYTPPPGLAVTPDVHALTGTLRMQRWFLVAAVAALAFIPLLICLVGYQR
jgi:type VI secretion system protein ImpK